MKKRRHHFVWQHYLRSWTVEGRISCWRQGRVFTTDPTNVAVETDFYRLREISERDATTIRQMISLFPAELREVHNGWLAIFTLPFDLRRMYATTGQSDSTLEAELERAIVNMEEEIHAVIEGDGVPLLRALRRGDAAFFGTEEGFSQFMHFLSVQYLRTKNMSARIAAALDTHLIDADSTGGVLRHIFAANMGAYFLQRRAEYAMTVLRAAAGTQFLTADQPVINTCTATVPGGVEPEDLEFYYPVTPARAVLIGRLGKRERPPKRQLDAAEVDGYNRLMALAAHAQLFAADERLLERMAAQRR